MRLLYRLPVVFVRTPLRRLLGEHLLLLTHVGRRTGRRHETVLEALRHDEDADVYYVVSAWGERADWLRNLRQTPEATLLVGDRRLEAVARPLAAAEGERELRRFVRRHPLPARLLLRILGRRLPAAEEGFRVLAEALVVVALRVRGTA